MTIRPKPVRKPVHVRAIRDGKDAKCFFRKNEEFYIDQDELDELELLTKGFLVIVPTKPPAPVEKPVPDSEKKNCLWLKPCPGWAYAEGAYARLAATSVEQLIVGGYVELLPDDHDLLPKQLKRPALDGPVVRFLKSEHTYACVQGTETQVYKSEAIRLLDNGFVDLASNDPKERNEIFRDLGYVLDPINKKLVRG